MICTKCNKKFLYKDIIKSAWLSMRRTIKCRKCGELYKISDISIWIVALIPTLPILFTQALINIMGAYTLLVYFLYIIFMALLSPFWIRFKPLQVKE